MLYPGNGDYMRLYRLFLENKILYRNRTLYIPVRHNNVIAFQSCQTDEYDITLTGLEDDQGYMPSEIRDHMEADV